MPGLNNKPKLEKGAFLITGGGGEAIPGITSGPTEAIQFQFNPETLERSLSGTWTSAQAQKQKAEDAADDKAFADLKGKNVKVGFTPQPEKINLTLKLDSDERTLRSPLGEKYPDGEGVLPELAALESMMKKTKSEVAVEGSNDAPTLVRTKELPLVVFVWGQHRVMPVTVLSMSISEQKFNYKLNPTRAEVKVSLQVLEEEDAKLNADTFELYKVTDNDKQRMKKAFLEKQGSVNLPKVL